MKVVKWEAPEIIMGISVGTRLGVAAGNLVSLNSRPRLPSGIIFALATSLAAPAFSQPSPGVAMSLCELVAKRQAFRGSVVSVKAALRQGPEVGRVFMPADGVCKVVIDAEEQMVFVGAAEAQFGGPLLPKRPEMMAEYRTAKTPTERMAALWDWVLVATFRGVFNPNKRLAGHGGELDHGQFTYIGHVDGTWIPIAQFWARLSRPAAGFEKPIAW